MGWWVTTNGGGDEKRTCQKSSKSRIDLGQDHLMIVPVLSFLSLAHKLQLMGKDNKRSSTGSRNN
jgi:hypothetical protein